ncbi:competence/damage-inducible protein A [Alkaliphilus pronyensis]|uniref:Putative competence-damage inducible protein n=1 Tax=Alkaliphilus pronyensis TaxID=1482732 RepID=A0A6I0FD50_9FIRM|nr:competence/damage-inducible protein A [Alkaliphilus pronyensis]KAB3536959.1 competence/damage-inducible protein A [Alkaliphilus pronyensis]
MLASIICIGTELVNGKTKDSNSYYISQKLITHGYRVGIKITVEDKLISITNSINFALSTSDILILTGGLGPTLDDITREAVSNAIGYPLEMNGSIKKKIIDILEKNHKKCPVNNFRQAYFPKGSQIIDNKNGTAAGFLVEFNSKKVFVLPGPPNEMKPMFNDYVLPMLKGFRNSSLIIKSYEIVGIGESALEEELMDFIQEYKNFSFATYALDGHITLTITAEEDTNLESAGLLKDLTNKIEKKIGDYIYSIDGSTLEEEVFKALLEKGLTLATAESCTGGLLASKLTSIPGISKVYEGGFITYSNNSKTRDLFVPSELISHQGAVSYEVAMSMLKGLKKRTLCNCGISITGIAGPEGGTATKPVGTVFVGINLKDYYEVIQLRLSGNRRRIQNLTTLTALNLLRKAIISKC